MEVSRDAFPVLAIVRLAVTIMIAPKAGADCNIKSDIGLALAGHAFSSFAVKDFHECYKECKAKEPKCRSMNYHGDFKRCDLNNASKTTHPADVKEHPFSLYFESHYRGK